MTSGADYERNKNYVRASGAFSVHRQHFIPAFRVKLPEAFGLTVAKSGYPHYFNTRANLDYVGKIRHYGVDEMSASERSEFLAWYEGQKVEVFDNRRVLESYCQDDVNMLREACQG